jgi:FtsH-binding integral membrane protein
MNGIFSIGFLIILAGSFIMDRKMLKKTNMGIKMVYGAAIGLILVCLLSTYLHMTLPMPTHFFIKKISPWVVQFFGI